MNQKNFILFAAVIGNILEYYDFTVYLVFYSAIAKAFFPPTSEVAATLQSLGVFAAGFITRPIGGILFGYIGDKYGRRFALICSVLGMAAPTFAMGLIPTYEEIGFFAPFLLVMFRLLQGLSISGEGAGAAIFVLEHEGGLKPGFVTGLVHGSNIAGTIIAFIVGITIDYFFSSVPHSWRFAFILGGFMGIIGFYLRLQVSETPIFTKLSEKKRTLKAPFITVVKNSFSAMFLTFCVAGVTSSIFYMVKSYVNIFYKEILRIPTIHALIYSTYASIILMIFIPFFGMLVDIFGKARVMKCSVISMVFFSLPALIGMASNNELIRIFSLTLLAMISASMSGCAYVFVISLFSPSERFTGVGFSYNLGVALFGGTSPIISRWLVETTNLQYAAGIYVTVTASLFLLIMLLMKSHFKDQDFH
ncbi:MAG: MFS transporter [Rickettsiaceae bacterium]|nr:MFS transporter [Rickettsiaceae bacterium]